jgi:hypothetical protein
MHIFTPIVFASCRLDQATFFKIRSTLLNSWFVDSGEKNAEPIVGATIKVSTLQYGYLYVVISS